MKLNLKGRIRIIFPFNDVFILHTFHVDIFPVQSIWESRILELFNAGRFFTLLTKKLSGLIIVVEVHRNLVRVSVYNEF
jgi:hypothetical protein